MIQPEQLANREQNLEPQGLDANTHQLTGAPLPHELPQEGVILMQDSASPEDKKKSFLMLNFIAELFLFLIFVIFLSHSIRNIYNNLGTDMSGVFECLMILNFSLILLNLVFFFQIDKQKLLGQFWLVSSATALTKCLAYLGFFLYAKDINNDFLGYCVYPDLLLRLFIYCSKQIRHESLQTIPLLHSFSLRVIAGFIEDHSLYALSMAFLIYYFLAAFLVSLVILVWIVFGYLLKVYLITPQMLNTFFPDLLTSFLQKLGIYFAFCCWLSYHAFVYIMLVFGLHQFIARGLIKPSVLPEPAQLPNSLDIAAMGLGQLGSLDLCVFVLGLFIFKDKLKELFEKFKGKKITFQAFRESLKLNLQKRGDNYFKRESGVQEPLIELKEAADQEKQNAAPINRISQFGECQICITNTCDTWFEPCGHTVVCQQCLKEFLKKYDACIFCRGKIDKVHLIYWDQESRAFKSKGVFNLNK